MRVCMFACLHVCIFACLHVCIFAYLHICTFAHCIFAHLHICIFAFANNGCESSARIPGVSICMFASKCCEVHINSPLFQKCVLQNCPCYDYKIVCVCVCLQAERLLNVCCAQTCAVQVCLCPGPMVKRMCPRTPPLSLKIHNYVFLTPTHTA